MKKTSIALAFACMCAGPALAQSSVTVYGIIDAGIGHEIAAKSITNLASGVASGSRLGFRGKEDLGGGMAAVFLLENGFYTDTGAQKGVLFDRQAYAGVSSEHGAVTFGRQYSPYYKALRDVADPFAAGLAGKAGNVMATNARVDNMVEYVSPKIAGFFVDLSLGLGEQAGDNAKSRTTGYAVGYDQGDMSIRVIRHELNNATATDSTKNTFVAASYNFGIAKANIGYTVNKGTGIANSTDAIIGGTIPFGATRLVASYIRHDDKTSANKDANQKAIGAFYGLSKRTDLYASYGVIRNDNGAVYTVGNATDKGSSDRAYNFGVRHTF